MQYRRFGNTDLEVSEICFGPMRFTAREPGEDGLSATGIRALERALGPRKAQELLDRVSTRVTSGFYMLRNVAPRSDRPVYF